MMIRFLGIMSLTDKYPSATKIIQTQIWNWALGVHGFVLILDAANQIRSSSSLVASSPILYLPI